MPACEALRKHKRFNVLFEHVEIDKLIQTVADVTCRTFIVPDNVKGRIFEAISERKTRERQRLLEEFWGERGAGEPPVDFSHKLGPLAAVVAAIRREENRPENGGRDNPGEYIVRPFVSPTDSSGAGKD